MTTIAFDSTSPQRTRAIGAALGAAVGPGAVIALVGPLGAGKTQLVRGLAEGLGLDAEEVGSPTFVICHEYGEDAPVPLVHIDAYRLEDPAELETIGFDELLDDTRAVLAIEWADRVGGALPDRTVRVALEHRGATDRRIEVTAPAPVVEALRAVVAGAAEVEPRCPICGEPLPVPAPDAPFCSTRCRQVDLGRWLGGAHRISRPAGGGET